MISIYIRNRQLRAGRLHRQKRPYITSARRVQSGFAARDSRISPGQFYLREFHSRVPCVIDFARYLTLRTRGIARKIHHLMMREREMHFSSASIEIARLIEPVCSSLCSLVEIFFFLSTCDRSCSRVVPGFRARARSTKIPFLREIYNEREKYVQDVQEYDNK